MAGCRVTGSYGKLSVCSIALAACGAIVGEDGLAQLQTAHKCAQIYFAMFVCLLLHLPLQLPQCVANSLHTMFLHRSRCDHFRSGSCMVRNLANSMLFCVPAIIISHGVPLVAISDNESVVSSYRCHLKSMPLACTLAVHGTRGPSVLVSSLCHPVCNLF